MRTGTPGRRVGTLVAAACLAFLAGGVGDAAAAGTVFTVTSASDSGLGSLRQAILDANANPGADEIRFAIGSGAKTISVVSGALPSITDTVTIDGTTQPGFKGVPLVRLDNGTGNTSVPGLDLAAGSSAVRGLVVTGFGDGIALRASNDVVGGAASADRNVISGNATGVYIFGAGASSNVVAGNYIGPDKSGKHAIGNHTGVLVVQGATSNTIGPGNVVSGNFIGVDVESPGTSSNVVSGNLIGTDATGSAALGNGVYGVLIFGGASSNTVGGTSADARNVISGNGSVGVNITGATANVVEGNFLGTDSTGTSALPNNAFGLLLDGGASDNLVARNVISGNAENGVVLGEFASVTGNTVKGNEIGTDASGAAALANGLNGVAIGHGSSANSVERNSIRFNAGAGVLVDGASGDAILRNSIFANGGLGISLVNGGNDSQPAPTITSVVTGGGTTTIDGTLAGSAPAAKFRIELFRSPSCDPSGNGEGRRFVGAKTLTTSASGDGSFSKSVSALASGQQITATATDAAAGDTSGFSACVTS
jgi:hypothetical protein